MKNAIDITNIAIGDFSSIWRPIFFKDRTDMFDFYKKMKYLGKPQLMTIEEEIEAQSIFPFIYNYLCWENIILPIYWMNGKKLNGRYKVLTNSNHNALHFVIYDLEKNIIFDPTYEKAQDSNLISGNSCKGTGCTSIMLGKDCFYFDLEYYFDGFLVAGQKGLIEQIKEIGSKIKNCNENHHEK